MITRTHTTLITAATPTAQKEGVLRNRPPRPPTPEMLKMRAVFRYLINHPGDADAMLAYSDSLEEAGYGALAQAYRWAAVRGKWPFVRLGSGVRGFLTVFSGDDTVRHVYDWNREITNGPDPGIPDHAQLPDVICAAIRSDKGRRYGGLHRAFVLLANALIKTGWTRVAKGGGGGDGEE